jgi:hypothetical protein
MCVILGYWFDDDVGVDCVKWCEMKMDIDDYEMSNIMKKNETMNMYMLMLSML